MYMKTRLVRVRGPGGKLTFGQSGEAEVVSAGGYVSFLLHPVVNSDPYSLCHILFWDPCQVGFHITFVFLFIICNLLVKLIFIHLAT
jgi:hypothetical protein